MIVTKVLILLIMRMIIDSNDDTVNVNANASDDWCKHQDTCCKNMKR